MVLRQRPGRDGPGAVLVLMGGGGSNGSFGNNGSNGSNGSNGNFESNER